MRAAIPQCLFWALLKFQRRLVHGAVPHLGLNSPTAGLVNIVVVEITDSTNRALGFALVCTVFSWGESLRYYSMAFIPVNEQIPL